MSRRGVPALLDGDDAAFLAGGVSIVAASRDPQRVPSIARAIGCRVSRDRRRVTLLLSATQSRELVEHVRATGAIAVVFSRPSTHRTIQLKGIDARVEPAAKGDAARAAAHTRLFAEDIRPLGYRDELAASLHACAPDDLVAIAFTVAAAFEQTPGPGAGTPLRH